MEDNRQFDQLLTKELLNFASAEVPIPTSDSTSHMSKDTNSFWNPSLFDNIEVQYTRSDGLGIWPPTTLPELINPYTDDCWASHQSCLRPSLLASQPHSRTLNTYPYSTHAAFRQVLPPATTVRTASICSIAKLRWSGIILLDESCTGHQWTPRLYWRSALIQITYDDLCSNIRLSDSPTAVFPVRFLVQAMVLFKESLAQWAPIRKDGTENTQGK